MQIAIVSTEHISQNSGGGGLATYVDRTAKALKQLGHDPVIFLCGNTFYKKNKKSKEQKIKKIYYDGQLLVEVPILYYQLYSQNKIHLSYFKTVRIFKKKLFKAPRPIVIFHKFIFWLKNKKKGHDLSESIIFEKYGENIIQSYFINKAILEFNNNKKIDLIHYTNLNGLAIFRPKNIPSIIRISGIHRLWWKVNHITPSASMIKQDQLEYDALDSVEKVIAPSFLIRDHILKEKKVDISIIETPFVNNVSQIDDSELKKYQLDQKKYILFFGQVSALKGVVEIAEIISEFLAKYPDYYYVFVGEKYKFEGKKIDQYLLSKAKDFSDRIIFIPRLVHQQLFPIIQNAKIITLPSRIDNLPNACIESMSLGKIVIGSRGASFDQLIEDGINGFLCEIKQPKTILKKIIEALELSDEQKKLISTKAKERIEKLSPEIVTKQLVEFYQSAIDCHKKNFKNK